ncbi:acyl-CoA carboxylase subunit epsilon [Streptomyces sp. CA-243310]|uniref:acyl-CoA carboxylase subunit epsilon n=1 Tax=Streptomyces sp. CA-243310 TaxID=3240056 RepID=UPI003D8FA73B
MSITADTLLKVEKGNAAPEELAAITAILLARAATTPAEASARIARTQAGWRRLERSPGFHAPHSWRG